MKSNYKLQGMSANTYQKNTPTVPMSVYRELAGELQATQKQLDDVKQENQDLYQQNQSLRSEVGKLIQSVQKLEGLLNTWEEKKNRKALDSSGSYYQYEPIFSEENSENWLTHQQEEYSIDDHSRKESATELNGWFVAAVLLMIVLTFTGIGFMVARPLLNNNSGK